jgi:transposase-like protein
MRFVKHFLQDASDIQDALKDLLGSTIQEMLESEMDNHLGYDKYERSSSVDNYRNGIKSKRVRSKYGELDINVPQDCILHNKCHRITEFLISKVKPSEKRISVFSGTS